MDRAAAAAIRLPPVARLARCALCAALGLSLGFPAAAEALALPPPLRLAVVAGRPAWSQRRVALPPPPGRYGVEWAPGGRISLSIPPRSTHG